jgi:hypothetical protein
MTTLRESSLISEENTISTGNMLPINNGDIILSINALVHIFDSNTFPDIVGYAISAISSKCACVWKRVLGVRIETAERVCGACPRIIPRIQDVSLFMNLKISLVMEAKGKSDRKHMLE